jgi:hypothetical protein
VPTNQANFGSAINDLLPKKPEWRNPAFRVSCFTISGDGVSLLLAGKLEKPVADRIGGTPIVLQNPVYDTARELYSSFATRTRREYRPESARQL